MSLVVVLASATAVAAEGRTWSSASADTRWSTRVLALALIAGVGLLWLVLVGLLGLRSRGLPSFRPGWVLFGSALAAVLVSIGLVLHGRLEAVPFQNHPGGVVNLGEGVKAPGGSLRRAGKSRGQRGVQSAWTFGAGGVALVLLTAAGVLVLRRRRGAVAVEEGGEGVVAAVSVSVEESLDDLRRERDARRAVIACYARMEQVLGRSGLRREPTEAPFEYLERVLVRLRASPASVGRLTRLFEEAGFSDHAVSERMRGEAIGALSSLQRELQATP